ncbi:MAG: oligoendopeptidase F [Clostridiales bacterium]|nr:oligoendopeptidase F [Candidatus Crickella equi]
MNNYGDKTRAEIPQEYKWNIEAMYADESKVEKDLQTAIQLANEVSEMQGHIMDSSVSLLKMLMIYSTTIRLVEKVFVYSHMRHDEDNANSKYTEMYGKAVSVYTDISATLSFVTPEILESTLEQIHKYIDEQPELETYRFMLEEIMLKKDHTLSKEQEFIMASLSEIVGCPDEIFTVLNDADLNFGMVKDENGIEKPLTHASYIQFMESEKREVRKEAYYAMYEKYKKLNNTISSLYGYNVKADTVCSNLRNYNSTLERALSSENIPTTVYSNLIDAVHQHLPAMHKYVKIRKKILGIDELKMYDVYRPLVKPLDKKYTFVEAVNIACAALSPLGEDYVNTLRNGILNEKWVDIYENKGKTSGAYSFGSFDSYPYILMNFTGDLRDIFTLIHEGGHSMHSYYTRKTQPYIYADHSIFTAEVASTVNETLLIKYLLEHCEDPEEKKYLINFYIDEFKSTLFRQTMFAEFEKIVHEQVEQGESLSAEYLNQTYNELNSQYFGPALSEDDMIQYEWSRIPHFYRSFYVYQYATGYSAANAIANRILNEGEPAVKDYLEFLTTGSSDYPIELLKIAGVDMSQKAPVLSALDTFDSLVDELASLL